MLLSKLFIHPSEVQWIKSDGSMPPQTRTEKGKYPSDWLQSESRYAAQTLNIPI